MREEESAPSVLDQQERPLKSLFALCPTIRAALSIGLMVAATAFATAPRRTWRLGAAEDAAASSSVLTS